MADYHFKLKYQKNELFLSIFFLFVFPKYNSIATLNQIVAPRG